MQADQRKKAEELINAVAQILRRPPRAVKPAEMREALNRMEELAEVLELGGAEPPAPPAPPPRVPNPPPAPPLDPRRPMPLPPVARPITRDDDDD